jgi:hypothetical protein
LEASAQAINASIKQEEVIKKQIEAQAKLLAQTKELTKSNKTVAGAPGQGAFVAGQKRFTDAESERLKQLNTDLSDQEKITRELLEGQTKLGTEKDKQAEIARRTVDVINEEIKREKDRRDAVSATSAEYKAQTVIIKKLEAELEAITGKAGAKTANKTEDKLKSLLEAIADAERDAAQSGLIKEDSEIDRINERYDDLIARAKEIKASEGILGRIENARARQVGNTIQKQQAEDYKQFITEQKALFDNFEEYKLSVGKDKAEELTNFQTKGYDDFIDFLKTQLAIVAFDQSIRGQLQKEIIASQIAGAEKDKAKKQTDDTVAQYTRLLKETQTFNLRRIQLEKQYEEDVALLKKLFSGEELEERLADLKSSQQEELEQLESELLRQSDAYRKLNTDITFYSRERIQQLKKDLEVYLKNTPGIPPAFKKQIEDAIKELNTLLKETSTLFKTGEELQKIASFAQGIGSAFDQLGSSVEGVNDELADTLKQLSSVIKIASDAINAVGQFMTGNIVGGIASAVSAIAGVFNFGRRAREERLRHQKELEEFNTRLFVGEQEINTLYRERLRDQVLLNKLRIEGLEDEKKLLLNQRDLIKDQYSLVLSELQKLTAKVAKEFTIGFSTVTLFSEESLFGKSFAELEELFLKGQLEGKAKELFELLQRIKQEGVDVDKLLAENADKVRQTFTGTTSDSITDSIVDGFKNGLRSASDFADQFQELMQNALLQALKFQTLEGPLKEFYDQFAEDAESDGVLSEEEIRKLRENFNSIIAAAGERFEELQQITGGALPGGSGGSNLSGAIKGITAQQADLLAGQFGGLRLTALEQLNTAIQGLRSLQNIEIYTANLVEVKAILSRLELTGIKVK